MLEDEFLTFVVLLDVVHYDVHLRPCLWRLPGQRQLLREELCGREHPADGDAVPLKEGEGQGGGGFRG